MGSSRWTIPFYNREKTGSVGWNTAFFQSVNVRRRLRTYAQSESVLHELLLVSPPPWATPHGAGGGTGIGSRVVRLS